MPEVAVRDDPETISISEAARRLGIDRRGISALLDTWGLPSRYTGNARLIDSQTYAALRERIRPDRGS